jgi:UDP-N-acetylglucosamine transferase subunit ALG13
LVFVTVGTDHHPFDRLMGWVDRWFEDGGGARARCMVQSGTSTPPHGAPWRAYLTHPEMDEAMAEAVCVVCHGGPTTIADAARHGKKPVIVPRLKALGEHVDDHQVAYTQWIGTQQEIEVVTSEERLRALLDLAISNPNALRTQSKEIETDRAVRLIGTWIDELVSRPRSGVLRRIRQGRGEREPGVDGEDGHR